MNQNLAYARNTESGCNDVLVQPISKDLGRSCSSGHSAIELISPEEVQNTRPHHKPSLNPLRQWSVVRNRLVSQYVLTEY